MNRQKGKKKKRQFVVSAHLPQKEEKYKFGKQKPKYWNTKPIFAFTHYDCKDKNNSFRCIMEARKFWKIFETLSGMCSLTWGKITGHHQYHGHDIGWTEKTLPKIVKKLEKNKNIRDYPLYQFKAYDDKSRILGFFNADCVYELVALDPKHGVYHSKRK